MEALPNTSLITPKVTRHRASELFGEHHQKICRETDRMFAFLLVLQWAAGILAAYWISPLTWIGTTSQTHLHVWAAVFLGGAITSLPLVLTLTHPGHVSTRHTVAVAQMLIGALLIHLTGGRIETHFHVFGSLAFLSFYRDWRVLIPATLVVIVDHFVRGVLWPQSVYGVLTASHWRWLEHTGWVLFEDTFLLIAIQRSVREMWHIAERDADNENLKEHLAQRVAERTAQLAAANEELEKEVAERKLAESSLRDSESRYRLLFESNPYPMLVYDLQTLRFLAVNEALTYRYGYSREELLNKTIKDIHPAEDVPALLANLAKGFTGLDEAGLWRHRKKDGTIIDVEIVSYPLMFDGHEAKLVMANDITERKRAEEELAEQRYFLRQVIDLNPHFIFAKDRDGRFTLVNQAVANAYGTTVEDLLGKRDTDFNFSRDETDRFRADDLEVIDTQQEKFIPEEVITDATGQVRWLQSIKRPIISPDGTVSQMLGVATDITKRKLAEEALHRSEEQLRQAQKMEAVGKLAGGVAHDFNNLLTAINGYTEISLIRLKPHDPLYSNLTEIKKAGERAASLTRQLLAFSRKQILQPKVLDLNQLVLEMEKMLQRLIGEDIDILVRLPLNVGKVKADPNQIEQVLMNLSVNARDAMPKGGKLTIETANIDINETYCSNHVSVRPGPYVMLAVSDTGCGMDAVTQQHVFEPFFTTKEVGKGTGLGLATVYGIVKQSEGNIWVYSEVGRGTTFKIYLPRIDKPSEEQKPNSETLRSPIGSETVLLVEDEELVRKMVKEILEEGGYQVLEAKHGNEAVEIAEQFRGQIDLMLSDVVMPKMGGRELAKQLAPIRKDMRVLYMSGYTDDAIVHHGVLDEGTAFIGKPFMPSALLRKVREILDMPLGVYP
jgi:two-component system cell cycle sensor histidine kinase/response regulator CckA